MTTLTILAEGYFGHHSGKTAHGIIYHSRDSISSVIDSTASGARVCDILPNTQSETPIVGSLEGALRIDPKPDTLVIGIAPPGGGLPDTYRNTIIQAISAGLHISSGLHLFLNDDPELVALAKQHNVRLWDVRDVPPQYNRIPTQSNESPLPDTTRVITMMGTDCAVGKMVTALALRDEAQSAYPASEFIPTGQTGIMIEGWGVPLDRVIADYCAGAMELAVIQGADRGRKKAPGDNNRRQWLFVEGQGSLVHPAYSSVTLGLLHGSKPDAIILCHEAGRTHVHGYEHKPLLSLKAMIEVIETASAWQKPARVVGVSLNTKRLSEQEAYEAMADVTQETGLVCVDPYRTGVGMLMKALEIVLP